MKPLLIIIALAIPSGACDQGCTEYEGACACDAPAEKAIVAPTPTSNEKPPRHPEPAWQRGDVHVMDAKPGIEPSTSVANDAKAETNQR